MKHLLLSAEGDDAALAEELARNWPSARAAAVGAGLSVVEGVSLDQAAQSPLAFARQMAPDVEAVAAASVREWDERVFITLRERLPENGPWRLHVAPHYGMPSATRQLDRTERWSGRRKETMFLDEGERQKPRAAGVRRGKLIRAALVDQLKQRRRSLLRSLREDTLPFSPEDSLVQVWLTSAEAGWLSVSPAPWPFALRRLVWPFPKGAVTVAPDKKPPSRAFAKLVEAEMRLGLAIQPGETCVDLGASPGSWSYVALQRGAHVIAVDRSPLRDDLMRNPGLQFVRGDAFAFTPAERVDWLLCDVIAAPERSIDLLLDWLGGRWTRKFVVTIKFKGRDAYSQLDRLKSELPALVAEWRLLRLCANKNEVCAFGACELETGMKARRVSEGRARFPPRNLKPE